MYQLNISYYKEILEGKGIRFYSIIKVFCSDSELSEKVLPYINSDGSIDRNSFHDEIRTHSFSGLESLQNFVENDYLKEVKNYIASLRSEKLDKIDLPADKLIDI